MSLEDSQSINEVIDHFNIATIVDFKSDLFKFFGINRVHIKIKDGFKRQVRRNYSCMNPMKTSEKPVVEEEVENQEILKECLTDKDILPGMCIYKETKEVISEASKTLIHVLREVKLEFYKKVKANIDTQSGFYFYEPVKGGSNGMFEDCEEEDKLNNTHNELIRKLLNNGKNLVIDDKTVVISLEKIPSNLFQQIINEDIRQLIWKHLNNRLKYVEIKIKLFEIVLKIRDPGTLNKEEIDWYKNLKYTSTLINTGKVLSFKAQIEEKVSNEVSAISKKYGDDNLKDILHKRISMVKENMSQMVTFVRRVKKIVIENNIDETVRKNLNKLLSSGCRGSLNVPNYESNKLCSYYIY